MGWMRAAIGLAVLLLPLTSGCDEAEDDSDGEGSPGPCGVEGPAQGPAGTISLADAHAVYLGENAWDAAGFGPSSGDDLNGDGCDDLVGAHGYTDEYIDHGKAHQPSGPWAGSSSLADAPVKFLGDGAARGKNFALSSFQKKPSLVAYLPSNVSGFPTSPAKSP